MCRLLWLGVALHAAVFAAGPAVAQRVRVLPVNLQHLAAVGLVALLRGALVWKHAEVAALLLLKASCFSSRLRLRQAASRHMAVSAVALHALSTFVVVPELAFTLAAPGTALAWSLNLTVALAIGWSLTWFAGQALPVADSSAK